MKVTEGRRLAAILGVYIGIFSLRILVPEARPYLIPIGLAATAVFSGMLLFRERRKALLVQKSVLILLMAAAVCLACIRGANRLEKTEIEAARYMNGELHTASGYVTKISYEKNYGSCYEIRLLTLDQKETELGVMLSIPYNGGFSVSDIVEFEGVFSPPEKDFVLYRKADGIFLLAEAESAEISGVQKMGALGFFEKIRHAIQAVFETYIDSEEAGFATAIMTGNRENLSGSVRLAFTRIGISHILAVSGLHLSIIVGGLNLLFQWIAVPRKPKNIILILCACFFACICGLSASVVRAAIMLSFLYLADTIGERHDSLTSLLVAIFLIVFFRPNAVYDVGMWMSFLATLGIVVAAPAIPRINTKKCPHTLRKIFNSMISLLFITVTATFFTLPITYIAFGGISLLSPIANLIFVFLTQIILYLLIALVLLGKIPFLASAVGKIAQALIAFVCGEADRLSDIEGIYVSLRYPFVFALIVLLVFGVVLILAVKRFRTGYLFGVFALCLVFYAVGYFGYVRMQGESTYVYVETDGKSDAVGIVGNGKTVIVDISTGGYGVLGKAVDHMEDFYACEIDTLVLTHYHSYHVNTLRRLTNYVKIHNILLPEPTSEQDAVYYRAICAQLAADVAIGTYPTDGTQSLRVGNAVLSLPETEQIKRSTHPIVRFSVSVGEKGVSYLGESATETDFSDAANAVVIFGSNGPPMKHIFDPSPIASAELIVFADRSHAELTDTERIHGEIAFPEDYGGWIKILFE